MSIEALQHAPIGIIGGSGVDQIEGLEINRPPDRLLTPFGDPSDELVHGEIEGTPIVFLRRHGPGHTIPPHQLPSRANIYALKKSGVRQIISVSAVGSLREEIEPGHLVVPDQILDETKDRTKTFFENGIVAHVSMADPFCPSLRTQLIDAAKATETTIHESGTLVVMQGPQFSTRAESRRYIQWGADIVGMTAQPEAALAREAGMCYATLALSTDYDAWRDEDAVTMTDVGEVMRNNVVRATGVLHRVIPQLGGLVRVCECSESLTYAMASDTTNVDVEILNSLAVIIRK